MICLPGCFAVHERKERKQENARAPSTRFLRYRFNSHSRHKTYRLLVELTRSVSVQKKVEIKLDITGIEATKLELSEVSYATQTLEFSIEVVVYIAET